jgi:hypothetical protein
MTQNLKRGKERKERGQKNLIPTRISNFHVSRIGVRNEYKGATPIGQPFDADRSQPWLLYR